MSFNVRKQSRPSYYEPDEPMFDEYLYCEQCSDFVYDYCAIHGPLLVIPDNKVPVNGDFPSSIPRAALTLPNVFLHIAPSFIPGAGLGVFSTLTLPRGVRFGPYCGQRTQNVNSMYCWQIFACNNKRGHVVDGADSDCSNWMRYVNCARHWKEQNLLAYQYKGKLYYRTIKTIPRFTELMVFYGSEFANALHVNLRKYNTKEYYKEIISTSTKAVNQNDNNDMQIDYLTEDQFYFIDESENKNVTEVDHSTQIETVCSEDKIKNQIKIDSRNVTEKTRHECGTCLKTFATSKYLKKHTLRHETIKKFNCEYCPYQCNDNYRFKQHVGKHTNTYQYSCDKCMYKTNYKRNFKDHNLNHLYKEKKNKNNIQNPHHNKNFFLTPKTCDICDFKTCSRKSFSNHMYLHRGNTFQCDLCSYSNHRKHNLSRHISKNH